MSDFILGGSKITADGDHSHEIKSRLLLERKVMTNLDSTLKSRDITLPTKVHLVKAMFFFHARILEWVAVLSLGDLPNPVGGGSFTTSATWSPCEVIVKEEQVWRDQELSQAP